MNNKARHNLIDAKCRWRSDRLDGAVSFWELLGQTQVMQIRERETQTTRAGGDNPWSLLFSSSITALSEDAQLSQSEQNTDYCLSLTQDSQTESLIESFFHRKNALLASTIQVVNCCCRRVPMAKKIAATTKYGKHYTQCQFWRILFWNWYIFLAVM